MAKERNRIQVMHTCPCGLADTAYVRKVRNSLTMQLATLGDQQRTRAKGITIHACDHCIAQITTPVGKLLRKALAEQVQAAAVDLRRRVKANGPN